MWHNKKIVLVPQFESSEVAVGGTQNKPILLNIIAIEISKELKKHHNVLALMFKKIVQNNQELLVLLESLIKEFKDVAPEELSSELSP